MCAAHLGASVGQVTEVAFVEGCVTNHVTNAAFQELLFL
jgi:hypothetical protein